MENPNGIHDIRDDWIALHLEHRINAYKQDIENDNEIYQRLTRLGMFSLLYDTLTNRLKFVLI